MPRIVTVTCLLACLSASAFGQFGSNTARRVISGTAAPPALCNASPVDMYARTGATLPGLYVCLTTNTWSGPLATSAGSGTVSANNGVVNAIATYAAAGGSTTVAPAANTACIPGATSGSVCLSAPAIAGTITNAATFTNSLQLPTGTALSFNGDTGLSRTSAGVFAMGNGTAGDQQATLRVNQIALGTGAVDTNISRDGAGIFDFGTGATFSTAGRVKAAGYMSVGTTFTSNAGCSETSLAGGATAGKYNSGTTGTCTVVITMGNSATAPNGWSCKANDLTTVADTQNQTATSTTTATISGTTVSGDVINFSCIGY